MKKNLIFCITILLLFFTTGCTQKPADNKEKTSIFSWSSSVITGQEQRSQLDQTISRLGITRVFQSFPKEPDFDETADFIKHLSKSDRSCYALLGKAKWAEPSNLAQACDRIETLGAYNQQAPKNQMFSGIVLDIEPYLLNDWDRDPERVMSDFLDNMTTLYQTARDAGLYTIICIPYWYDNDYADILASLVENCCDELAVMNYYIGEEYEHLKTELDLCRKTGKPIVSISEFQSPGHHDLTDETTYYNHGLAAASQMWETLKEESNYEGLSFSYHYLDPVYELLNNQ